LPKPNKVLNKLISLPSIIIGKKEVRKGRKEIDKNLPKLAQMKINEQNEK
jgi:hypothetical protein